jgi:hypothetical protein
MPRRAKTQGGSPSPLTKDELQRMAKHVQYEMDEVLHAFDKWGELNSDDDKNPVIEVALLHLRILSRFFLNYKEDDDITGRDYVQGWKPSTCAKALLDEYRGPINKRLAHLSRQRAQEQRPWPRISFETEIKSLIKSFVEKLNNEQRTWFNFPSLSERKPFVTDAGSTETRSYHHAFLNDLLTASRTQDE